MPDPADIKTPAVDNYDMPNPADNKAPAVDTYDMPDPGDNKAPAVDKGDWPTQNHWTVEEDVPCDCCYRAKISVSNRSLPDRFRGGER